MPKAFEPTPSQASEPKLEEGVESRRRAPTAHKAMVKACSRPRTAFALAAKAEVGRKSLDLTVMPVRFRPRAPIRSRPCSHRGGFFVCASLDLLSSSESGNLSAMRADSCGVSNAEPRNWAPRGWVSGRQPPRQAAHRSDPMDSTPTLHWPVHPGAPLRRCNVFPQGSLVISNRGSRYRETQYSPALTHHTLLQTQAVFGSSKVRSVFHAQYTKISCDIALKMPSIGRVVFLSVR